MNKSTLVGVLALAVAAAGLLLLPPPAGKTEVPGPAKFASEQELTEFLGQSEENTGAVGGAVTGLGAPVPLAAPRTAAESGAPDYSTTNIQVPGVDEADIVKSDGKNLYVVSGGKVSILSAYPPESARLLSRVEPGGQVRGIFVQGDWLAVLGEESVPGPWPEPVPLPAQSAGGAVAGAPRVASSFAYPIFYGTPRAYVKVYSIAARERPVLRQNVTLNGSHFDSRLIGNLVYAVVNDPVRWLGERVLLPRLAVDGKAYATAPSDITHFNRSGPVDRFTTVLAVDLRGGEVRRETFLMGSAQVMYVSPDSIYVASVEWPVTILPMAGVRRSDTPPVPPEFEQRTTLHKIAIGNGDIRPVATGSVPGRLLNRFSMDPQGGYLRVATTAGEVWSGTSRSNLYVLDGDLKVVGRLEGLAPGERIYSARFLGDRAYLVTFQKVDPFFAIDLRDPRNPAVLGSLKIPGYSDYLQPFDETHLLGIGKDAVEADTGNFAWYLGLKLSLFDVSNVSHPVEQAKVVVGDRGTDSEVLRDPKALLFSRARGLLVLPVHLAQAGGEARASTSSPPAYGRFTFQGAYVWNVSPERGFEFRGRVTHAENASLEYGIYPGGSDTTVRRALYIGEVLYTVSDAMVKMNRLDTLEETGRVLLS